MSDAQKQQVIILGAGVIGLQAGVRLLEAGYAVSIVAKHLPGDESIEYTSPWAGAHWRPHGTADDPEQCQWDIESYNEWMRLYNDEFMQSVPEPERAGILPIRSRLLWDSASSPELQPTGKPADIWFAPHVQNYKPSAPPDASIAAAAQFTAVSINVPQFLPWLARRFTAHSGRLIRATLPLDRGLDAACDAAALAASSPASPPAVFVNATGLAARTLCADPAVYPARGQTVLVRGVAHGCVTRQGAGYIAYCIPRPGAGATVLGGTKQAGRCDGAPDARDTAAILARARDLCPELLAPYKDRARGKFHVLAVNVGLRPMRRGGARMAREVLPSGRVVVHAYGHGGAGFQNAFGVAGRIVELVGGGDGESKGTGARL